VTPRVSPRSDNHPQVVVESAQPGLRDLVGLEVGPRVAGEADLRVGQRPELPADEDVVLCVPLVSVRCSGVRMAPRTEPVPVGARDGELT